MLESALLCYSFVALVLLRPVVGHLAWLFWSRSSSGKRALRGHRSSYSDYDDDSPTGEQWFGAFCLGACFVALWPLLVGWVLADRRERKVGAEREAELRALRARTEELERDLDQGMGTEGSRWG